MSVLTSIRQLIAVHEKMPTYLDVLFGNTYLAEIEQKPVVIFGAGALGKEMYRTLHNLEIAVSCFVDNDANKWGRRIEEKPILSVSELKGQLPDAVIILAVQKSVDELRTQLLNQGFSEYQIKCDSQSTETKYLFMYAMVGSQALMHDAAIGCDSVMSMFEKHGKEIQMVYDFLADEKSKKLFVTKMALIASEKNYSLFKAFMDEFSEPLKAFGPFNYDGTPEDYFYFNNDVIGLENEEVFVDVGAFDGDTIETFSQACIKQNVDFKRIYAFEPDPSSYLQLINNFNTDARISCHKLALGSQVGKVKFLSSNAVDNDKYAVGIQHQQGDVSVDILPMDEFVFDDVPTIIKMDPGANVIPDILDGAVNTIQQFQPTLILGAYHSLKALFEIPLLVHKICPEYKIYLRHGTYHLSDTDMFAIPPK